MSDASDPTDQPRLVLDDADGADADARTAATLLGSLAARLGTLFAVSGAEAVGAQIAGFAAVGRDVGRTAEGDRLRGRLERSRAGMNGEMLWQRLQIDQWLSSLPPSPILEDLANDLALLLCGNLPDALHQMDTSTLPIPRAPLPEPQPVHLLDALLGIWAVGRQLTSAVEGLVKRTEPGDRWEGPPAVRLGDGDLLR